MSQHRQVVERRRFIRHPICFPLVYKVVKKGLPKDLKGSRSTTINISKGGLLFSAKRPVEVDSSIIIRMPFQNKFFSVEAKVVHCNKDIHTKLYNIGVCFQNPSEAFKARLVEQMYLISEYRDLRSMKLGKEISLQEASREWIKRYSKKFQELYW